MAAAFKLGLLIVVVLYGAAGLQWWMRSRKERRARHDAQNNTVLHKLGMLKPGETPEDVRRRASDNQHNQ